MATLFSAFVVLALVSYVVLDGFDLGVGLLFPFTDCEKNRTLMMASIAPIWDGNETFLVLGVMVLLTGFPAAVSVILPALFVPMAIMLIGLVLRGVAFEFRAYVGGVNTKPPDVMFAAGSLLMALGQGFALGAFVQGLPVLHTSSGFAFNGGPLSWCTPFSVLVGICLSFGYALLGATWLIWRTDGPTQTFARLAAPYLLLLSSLALLLVSAATLLVVPTAIGRWVSWPDMLVLLPIPILAVAAIFLTNRSIGAGPDRRPFFCSLLLFSAAFGGLVSLLWPYAVPYAMTLDQAAAARPTLNLMAVVLVAILPVIYGYLALQYRVFRGKTRDFDAERPSESVPLAVARSQLSAKGQAVTGGRLPKSRR